MKKISLILIALFSTIALLSCKKYLDVNPKTQTSRDVLFSTESGFKDALSGVYIQMKNNDAYSLSLTQRTVESLVSSWDVSSGGTLEKIGLFNYTDAEVQSSFASIWRQQYRIISSINAILGQIDAKKNVFTTPNMYETIKGECLALRAYVHLDVLRLFGPVPTEIGNASPLPYVTVLSTAPTQKLSFAAFKAALYKDLEDAESLLKDRDPIMRYSVGQLKNTQAVDTYLTNRHLRMNYYAVKGLQARTYLWFNDTAKAYLSAKTVIDAKNEDGTAKFRLGTLADLNADDFVLTAEHLFGLYDYEIDNRYANLYGDGGVRKGDDERTIKNRLYENTGTDIREIKMWNVITLAYPSTGTAYVIRKYEGETSSQIPMLRLSEMYLIAAESAPFSEGVNYFNTFLMARNIPNTTTTNIDDMRKEIVKEYRKEFYAEGQAFFTYKRLNVPKALFLFAPNDATINYVVPVPLTEGN